MNTQTGLDDFDTLLTNWKLVKAQLAPLVAQEKLLRTAIFILKFPHPVEGTNKVPLGFGYQLKGTYPITRKIDLPVMQAIQKEFPEKLIPPDIIKTKYELNLGPYRTLTEEQKQFVDQMLIIKPGSIALELIPPKEEK